MLKWLLAKWRTYEHGFQYERCESYIERRLFKALVKAGHRVIAQQHIGYYRVDLYLPKHNLVIECNGKEYHSTYEQIQRDTIRMNRIKRYGYNFIAFSGVEINRNLSSVVHQISHLVGHKRI